jgi:hypothetical protein
VIPGGMPLAIMASSVFSKWTSASAEDTIIFCTYGGSGSVFHM